MKAVIHSRFEAATAYEEEQSPKVKREAVGMKRRCDVGDLHCGKKAVKGAFLCT